MEAAPGFGLCHYLPHRRPRGCPEPSIPATRALTGRTRAVIPHPPPRPPPKPKPKPRAEGAWVGPSLEALPEAPALLTVKGTSPTLPTE